MSAEGLTPHLSLVMPCYNEEDSLGVTAPALVDAFHQEGIRLELVLVDNGSQDRTGRIIDEMIEQGLPITKVVVPVNRGYGYGVVQGLNRCTASLIGYLCADGQVAPEDVVRTFRLMEGREERVLAKVRRRFRQDSLKRKIISVNYNLLLLAVYGGLGALDINGSPKIFSRRHLSRLRLTSNDWFLDPEFMIKTKQLGLRVIEIDVEGYARHGGTSNVRGTTVLEFLKNIFRYRFGGALDQWKRSLRADRPDVGELMPPRTVKPQPRRTGTGHQLSDVLVLEQNRHEDERGFLHKVLSSYQCEGRPPRGEVYVTSARPGEIKGNHYHRRMGEWFAVVQGAGTLEIVDPATDERLSVTVSARQPQTIYVPPGLAHALVNSSDDDMICVAWAESEYDPTDVVSFTAWPLAARAARINAALTPRIPEPHT